MIPYYLSAGIPGNSTLSDKVLLLWHIIGLVAIITIFTFVRSIPYENVRYEICRLATFYYIPLTLMAGLYLILRIYTRAYQFVLRHTGQTMSPRMEAFLVDKKFFAVFFTLIIRFFVSVLSFSS